MKKLEKKIVIIPAIKSFGKNTFDENKVKDEFTVTPEVLVLNQIFRNGLYEMPDHQRGYDWSKKLAIDFLKGFIGDNLNSTSVLGMAIFSSNDTSKLQIEDGQQRITNIVLILAGLRENAKLMLLKEKDSNNIKILESFISSMTNYLYPFIQGEGNNQTVLSSKQLGSQLLEQICIGEKNSTNLPKAADVNGWEKIVILNYKAIFNLLKQNQNDTLRIAERILFGTSIVTVTYPKGLFTAKDFITLNTQQKTLSFEQIIYAYIGEKKTKTNLTDKWNHTKAKFNSATAFDKYLLNFIKAYYPKCESLTKNNVVQKFIQLKDNNLLDIQQFVDKFHNKSDFYLSIIQSDKSLGSINFKEQINFDILKSLGFETYLPISLILSDLDNKVYFSKILESVRNVHIINQTILGKDAQIVTSITNPVLKIINSKVTSNTLDQKIIINKKEFNEIEKLLNHNKPSIQEIELGLNNLVNKKTFKNQRARGILLLLEEEIFKISAAATKINLANVHIDHFFPENSLSQGYLSKKQYDKIVFSLGNLRILKARDNSSFQDKHPKEKISTYKRCSLGVTELLFSFDLTNEEQNITESNANILNALKAVFSNNKDVKIKEILDKKIADSTKTLLKIS